MANIKGNKMSNSYQFTLILEGIDETTPGLEDSIFEAGCQDALINYKNGTVYLDFDREGESLENAIITAIKDIESANIRTKISRIENQINYSGEIT